MANTWTEPSRFGPIRLGRQAVTVLRPAPAPVLGEGSLPDAPDRDLAPAR